MEKKNLIKTPGDVLLRIQIVHLGKILFNLQFIFVIVMFASILTFILPAIYYLVLAMIALVTLFILFADPTFRSLWAGGEVLTEIAAYLANSWKYTIPLVAVFSISSIICLCFDKNKKQLPRIVISSILFIIAMIILVLKYINTRGA